MCNSAATQSELVTKQDAVPLNVCVADVLRASLRTSAKHPAAIVQVVEVGNSVQGL